MSSISVLVKERNVKIQKQYTQNICDCIQSQNRIQIALFHVRLGLEAIHCSEKFNVDENDLFCGASFKFFNQIHEIFCDTTIIHCLWFNVTQGYENEKLVMSVEEELDRLSTILERISHDLKLYEECMAWCNFVKDLFQLYLRMK